jgi:hypothetical protein
MLKRAFYSASGKRCTQQQVVLTVKCFASNNFPLVCKETVSIDEWITANNILIPVSIPEPQTPEILAFFLVNPANYDRKAIYFIEYEHYLAEKQRPKNIL